MKIIVASILAAILTVLAVLLTRFNIKRLHIIRRAKAASNEQLEAIY